MSIELNLVQQPTAGNPFSVPKGEMPPRSLVSLLPPWSSPVCLCKLLPWSWQTGEKKTSKFEVKLEGRRQGFWYSCPKHLTLVYFWVQVCGSDGVLYPSHCELHQAACRLERHISPRHRGNCRYTCSHVKLYTFLPLYIYTCIPVHMYNCTPVYQYTCITVHLYTCTYVIQGDISQP